MYTVFLSTIVLRNTVKSSWVQWFLYTTRTMEILPTVIYVWTLLNNRLPNLLCNLKFYMCH